MATTTGGRPLRRPGDPPRGRTEGTCRLETILTITTYTADGAEVKTRYRVLETAAGPGQEATVRLCKVRRDGSATDEIRDVTLTEHGPVCDCADFQYRREGLDPEGCKHVRSLIAVGLINPPAPAPPARRPARGRRG